MKHHFSLALSDEEESMEWFELLINNLSFNNEKLKEELAIERPDGRKIEKIEYKKLAEFLNIMIEDMEKTR